MIRGTLILLAWSHLFACGGSTCGPAHTATAEGCPIDPCVAECTSKAAAIACCVDAHGRGLEGQSLDRLAYDCVGEACDPDRYLSEDAAICVAEAHGMESGIGACGSMFMSRTWTVINQTWDGCPDSPQARGQAVHIDGVTGELIDTGVVVADVDCP
jgi:hypothetical protein